MRNCFLANKSNLKKIIVNVLKNHPHKENILFENWFKSSYLPTPTIIEASKVLYRGHSVSDISRNEAGSDNLENYRNLNKVIDASKDNGENYFSTGVPELVRLAGNS